MRMNIIHALCRNVFILCGGAIHHVLDFHDMVLRAGEEVHLATVLPFKDRCHGILSIHTIFKMSRLPFLAAVEGVLEGTVVMSGAEGAMG